MDRFNQSKFFFGDHNVPRSGLINGEGKTDTSRRFYQVNRRNFIYRPYVGEKRPDPKARPNYTGKSQGTGQKFQPRALPPLKFKEHIITRDEPEKEKWFNEETFIDYEMDDEFDDVVTDLHPHLNEKLVKEPGYMAFLRDDVICHGKTEHKLNAEAKEFIPKVMEPIVEDLVLEEQDKETQGLLMLGLDIGSALASATGYYYLYKLSENILTTFTSTKEASMSILEAIKEHFDVIAFCLVTGAKVYQGTMEIETALLLLTAYLGAKTFGKSILQYVKESFLGTFSSLQSTDRTSQGIEMNFVQSAISLIGALILGTSIETDMFKKVMTSIKSLGSTLLTVKSIETIVVEIINLLPDIMRIMLSEKFPTVSRYVFVATDPVFKKMLADIHVLMAMKDIDIMYSSHFLNKFLVAYNAVRDLIEKDESTRRGIYYVLEKELEFMDAVYDKITCAGLLPNKRNMPYVIWISGDPGIGKSAYVKTIVEEFLKTLLDKTDVTDEERTKYVYYFNTALKYVDGYNNQPITVINDYLQFAADEEEKWLIKMVDTLECPLEPSSIQNVEAGIKGEVRFTSRLIIVTSNSTYLSSSPNIKDLVAFNRRRDFLVEMRWTGQQVELSDVQKRSEWNYEWANCFRLHPTISTAMKTKYENIDEVMEDMIASYMTFNVTNKHMLNLSSYTKEDCLVKRAKDKLDIQGLIEKVLGKTYKAIDFNHKILGIPLKVLLPGIMLGTGAYVLIKAFLSGIGSKVVQSLSGDVTTKKRVVQTRPLMRTTMGVDMNLDNVATRVGNNIVEISTVIEHDGKSSMIKMWGVYLGGSLLMTPKHLYYRGDTRIADKGLIEIEAKGILYKLEFDESRFYCEEDHDIAIYNTFGQILSFRSLETHLIRENDAIRTSTEQAVLMVKNEFSFMQSIEAYLVDNESYVDPYGKRYKAKSLWQYNVKFRVGDCGSPMLLTDSRYTRKFAGMHVAGDLYSGNSEIVTYEMYKRAESYFGERKSQGFATDCDYLETKDESVEQAYLEGNFVYLGQIERPIFQNSKTDIRPSPFYEVLGKHTTEPAVLSPSDKRLKTPESPLLKSIEKYGKYIKPFDTELMEKAFVLVRSVYEPIAREGDLEVFTHNEAINATGTPSLEKLDMKTSAGYPWCTRGKDKRDLIDFVDDGKLEIGTELQNLLNSNEKDIVKGKDFQYTLIATLKDERVATEKIEACKTRTFTIFPVNYTILMRKYFDDFIDKETKYALEIGTTVGVNIYSTQWDQIYRDLKRFEYHIDGDYSSFDSTIRAEFFLLYARLVNSFYKDDFAKVRQTLMVGNCFAPMLVLDQLYIKVQGNPSGSRTTTSFNSFVNRMYLAMVYLQTTPIHMHNIQMFNSNLRIYAHGDDHLLGLTAELAQYMNAFHINDFLSQHNIGYTSSIKGAELTAFKPLLECSYLKSYFVYDQRVGRFKSGLNKQVIREMVSWQRSDDIEDTKMILNTALRYSFFWGKDFFNIIKADLTLSMRNKRLNISLLDYDSLENEYNYKGMLVFDYIKSQ